MAIRSNHAFVSAIPDGPDATQIRPSNWNADIALKLAGGRLVGRATAGDGLAEEITLGAGLSFSGLALTATQPTGTGFPHVTAGALDAAAKLIDTADINPNQVTNDKLAQMSSKRFKGRTSGGVGDAEDLSVGTVQSMLGIAAPIAAMTLVGNNTGASATAQAALTVAQVKTMLDLEDSGWIAPTLLNSWTNLGTPFSDAGYRKVGKTVYIRGTITGGTFTGGTNIFTLPAGYFPTSHRIFMVNTNGGFARMDVRNDGSVQLSAPTGTNAYMSLDGLIFQVD